MPNTTNFNWVTPADTDLVKDGAAAIRTLGNNIDTSFVDLKGGTTGQVLSKATNADLDFSWTTPTDQTPLTTKGDLFTFTTVDARLGVGANGTVLTADSAEATGLKWAIPASGGMTLLASGSLSGTETSLTNISQDYVELVLYVMGFRPQSANPLQMRLNADSSGRYNMDFGDDDTARDLTNTEFYVTGTQNQTTSNSFVEIIIPRYTATTSWQLVKTYYVTNSTTSSQGRFANRIGVYNQSVAISSIQLRIGGETFQAGTYVLYGVK